MNTTPPATMPVTIPAVDASMGPWTMNPSSRQISALSVTPERLHRGES